MTGLEQIGIAVFGVAALFLGLGNNPRHRKWAPIVGLIGQPFWGWFAWRVHSEALAVLIPAYTAAYAYGALVQWAPPRFWAWWKGVRTYWIKGRAS